MASTLNKWLGTEQRATMPAEKPVAGEFDYDTAQLHDVRREKTKDGKWLSIGCLEPWFWKELCEALGREDYVPEQNNREKWPEMIEWLSTKFKEKTRDEWFEELRHRDICVAPVLAFDEVFEEQRREQRREARRRANLLT